TAHASFSVTVALADDTPPVITGMPADRTVEANGPNGSVVNFSTPTANDALDGPVPVTCSPAPGANFPLGATTVTCSATDTHGNTATGSFTVTVLDTTAPKLVVPADRNVYADTPSGIDSQSDAAASFL